MKDSTKRFSDCVEYYVKYRPSYPYELVEVMQREGIITNKSTIADIGSGTGIFTVLLLKAGCFVYGVEPNDEMRFAAEKFHSQYHTFVSVNGRAEKTSLKKGSVDVITAAQAFHWFGLNQSRKEFLRILKPQGYVVLIWNERLIETIPFQNEYELLLRKYCPEYGKSSSQKISQQDLEQFYGHSKFHLYICANHQSFDFGGLRGRLESSSYCLKDDHKNYPMLMSSLKELFDRYQTKNTIILEYISKMYYGKLL